VTVTATVALTFDDGPSEWTGPILDHLARFDSRATFFILGSYVSGRENLLRRMAVEGHELGAHGWSHTPFTKLTTSQLLDELTVTAETIERATGTPPTCWRPPHHMAGEVQERVADSLALGPRVGTNLDPGDWYADADQIVERVVNELKPRTIVNLHDGVPPSPGERCRLTRQPTVDAVGRLLAWGLRSITVAEMSTT
jgi:peptidoglycan/xylan/chitin deacetylase (PgdA/CDA1 family)